MATKVWNFLLPGAGSHSIRVESIGDWDQKVIIDGELHSHTEALTFAGPENTLLELRHQEKMGWILLVDGLIVEDYHNERRPGGDESLRELKHHAEGSFMISPSFVVSEADLNVTRKFQFIIGEFKDGLHEVTLAHEHCVWQVVCDGVLIAREAHRLADNNGDASFLVNVAPGLHVRAIVHMLWLSKERLWSYKLTVNGVDVPASWRSDGKLTSSIETLDNGSPPVVMSTAALLALAPLPQPEEAAHAEVQATPAEPATLPQGVSVDHTTGKYLANLRNKTGKFIFLGEFSNVAEAHDRYLEAVATHCP